LFFGGHEEKEANFEETSLILPKVAIKIQPISRKTNLFRGTLLGKLPNLRQKPSSLSHHDSENCRNSRNRPLFELRHEGEDSCGHGNGREIPDPLGQGYFITENAREDQEPEMVWPDFHDR
jgi:hypothetical protein